jgi:hypothetical protein
MEGSTMAIRDMPNNMLLPNGDPGHNLGGTMTANSTMPTVHDYEAFFGPAARNIKFDNQRHKRHQRWHLPDVLDGPNDFLTDRVDGLITDATNSPFTRNILPYVYMANPDAKFKWNVYSFDEGLANRVPYESAARVLTQTKRSQQGYLIRQGLAIQMEHNFMMSTKGREDFQRQLQQLVGSIQLTNDLDVHMALLRAPSYEKDLREKYSHPDKTMLQLIRQYVDMYGIMQKHPNALDIIIEDAKRTLKKWGSPDPSFLMCNGALTMQLTMNVEKTQYITQGIDGVKTLRQGPDLPSYRGLSIIHSKQFSMQNGEPPRDILRRRSRVAEHYRINGFVRDIRNNKYKLYDQSKDSFFTLTFAELFKMSLLDVEVEVGGDVPDFDDETATTWHAPTRTGDREAFRPYAGAQTVHVIGNPQPVANFVYPPRGDFRSNIAVVYDNADAMQGCQAFREGYESMQAAQNMGLISMSKSTMSRHMDTLLAHTSGFEALKPTHTLSTEVTSMNVNHSGLIQWTAQAFRDARSKLKAPNGLLDTAAREVVALKMKKVTMQGNDRIKIHIANIPSKEIEAAISEGARRPYTLAEVNAAISILGSVLMNAVRAPNALNPAPPKDIEVNAHSFIQAVMSRSLYGTRLCNALLQPLDVPADMQVEFLRALDVEGDRSDILQATGLENPLCSTALVSYMALAHPDASVKQRCSAILGTNAKAIDDTVLQYMNEVLGYVEGCAKDMKTLCLEVPLLTSMLDNVAQKKVPTFKHQALFTTSTGAMYLNDEKQTLHSTPMFSSKVDEDLRTLLQQNGVKLDEDTLLGTEFRCYPFPVNANVNMEDINSVINHSDVNEYSLKAPLNSGRVNAALSAFTNSERCRELTLAHFYRNALCRLFTSVVSYANDNVKYFAVPAAKEITGTVRNVNAFRNVSSPLITTLGASLPVIKDPRNVTRIHTGDDNQAVNNALTENEVARHITQDTVPLPMMRLYTRMTRHNIRLADYEDIQIPGGMYRNPFLDCYVDLVIVRPNIEHNMLAVIMGRGGNPELGATYWGQTELSCYDDSQHGLWGMSYKYHESAIVHNEKNLIRVWDVCFDGYNGGMDSSYVNYQSRVDLENFKADTSSIDRPYEGKSMFVMSFLSRPNDAQLQEKMQPWPNPIVFYDPNVDSDDLDRLTIDPDNLYTVTKPEMRVFRRYENEYLRYIRALPDFRQLHVMRKVAGQQSIENETNQCALSFHGQLEIVDGNNYKEEIQGTGHLGPSYPGIASIREGKGYRPVGVPTLQRIV